MMKIKGTEFDIKARGKNIYFWIGIIGIMLASAGVDFETLTSWKLFFNAIGNILGNPVAIVSVIMAFLGVFVETSTDGLGDK